MGNNLTAVDLGTNFIPTDIEAGGYHTCALSELQEIKCWGQNTDGQLGIGCGWTQQFGDNLPTLEFPPDFVPQFMGLGGRHSCFVSTNGFMVCTGANGNGQVTLLLHFMDVCYRITPLLTSAWLWRYCQQR